MQLKQWDTLASSFRWIKKKMSQEPARAQGGWQEEGTWIKLTLYRNFNPAFPLWDIYIFQVGASKKQLKVNFTKYWKPGLPQNVSTRFEGNSAHDSMRNGSACLSGWSTREESDSHPWDAVACASVLHGGIRVPGPNNSDPTPTHPEPLCQCFKLHIHELNFSLIGKLNNEKQLYKDKPRPHLWPSRGCQVPQTTPGSHDAPCKGWLNKKTQD